MKIGITFFVLAIIALAGSGNSHAAASVYDCVLEASATFDTGDVIDGAAVDDLVAGIETLEWLHDSDEISFEAKIVEDVECRLNGATTADLIGVGVFNGVDGFPFLIEIEDNRPPPDSIPLTATISRMPTRRTDGFASFAPPRPIVIPAEVTVTAGGSGAGKVKLVMDDIDCRYVGTGPSYVWDRCEDTIGNTFMPGVSVAVSTALLRIQQSDRSFDMTSVEVDIGTGPVPGAADFYSIIIGDPVSGGVVFSYSNLVEDGDIKIDLIRPRP